MALQVYWVLFDYIKAKYGNEKLSRYTNFMGVCFEEYVFRLLTRIYPSSPRLGGRLVREITYHPRRRTTSNHPANERGFPTGLAKKRSTC